MGKYINTKLNDLAELYVLINDIERKDFKGYLYGIWNGQHLRGFAKHKGLKRDFTGAYPSPDINEYIKWLELKYDNNCNYDLLTDW